MFKYLVIGEVYFLFDWFGFELQMFDDKNKFFLKKDFFIYYNNNY